MGQEQSSEIRPLSASSADGGVQRVHATGRAGSSRDSKDKVDQLLETSSSLQLPQKLLPPPPVKDDVPSALQGAQVMHELNRVLGGLILGIEQSPSTRADSTTREPTQRPDHADGRTTTEGEAESSGVVGEGYDGEEDGELGDNNLQRRRSSIDEFSKVSEEDTRAEQDRWARLGIDQAAVNAMLEECTGGLKMSRVLDRQALLMQQILAAKEKSVRLKTAMDKNSEDARRTTKALERLDRIHVALADVQENLESAVATANILGASHFAHDDEMCSFKNFLRHNPPVMPE